MTKPERRDKGEGALYFSKSKNCWAGSFWLENGKRKYITASIKGDNKEGKRQAKQRLDEAMRLDAQGTLVASSATTIEEYLRDWLETMQMKIRRSSYSTWKGHIEIHIIPILGGYKLQQLRPEHIQKRLIMALVEKRLSPSSIKDIYKVLHHALSDAVKHQKLSISPCRNIVLPIDDEDDDEEMQVLSKEQVLIFFDYLAKVKHPREALFVAAATTGMRSGEFRSLRWADVDLDDAVAHVRHTVVHIVNEGYFENKPKTKSGKRKIPLTVYAVTKLRAFRTQQIEQCLKSGIAWSEESLVFQGVKGSYYSRNALKEALDKILVCAGLPAIRVHDLRHTAATQMLISGMNIESVRKIMGHSTMQMTLKYVHFLGDTLKEDMRRFSSYLDILLA